MVWKRSAVYLALAAAACWVGWLQYRAAAPTPDPAFRPAKAAGRGAPAAHADPWRLSPDVRVLEAAGDLHHLIVGGALEDARAEFEDGAWRIVHRGVVVGTLPEIPDFTDLERLLAGWARTLGLRDSLAAWGRRAPLGPPASAEIGARLMRLEATGAADLADRQWSAGQRGRELLRLAGRALVLLSLQSVDGVGASDRVAARALAVVAACAALDPDELAAEEALLAEVMGYCAAAAERAASLAADDPVRLFVRHEDAPLERRAEHRAGTTESRYLALLRIARRHDLDRWRGFMERHFAEGGAPALALTCTSLEIARFESRLPAAFQVLAGVVQDLRLMGEGGGDLPDDIDTLEGLILEFERLMEGMRPTGDGVFLDAGVLRAYYRTCFYSALAIAGEHLRESLSSLPDTRAFASDLGDGGEGAGGEFRRWYTHLANAKLGRPEPAALRRDLLTLPHFGAPLLLRTYDAIRRPSGPGEPGLMEAARGLARRLDSRPQHLAAFASVVRRDVRDLERAERLFARAVAARGREEPELRAWWARHRGDAAALEEMLADPGLLPSARAEALESLAAIPGADSAAVEARWQRSVAANPASWELADGYARLLVARGRGRRAAAVLERWLRREGPYAGPYDEIVARTRLAQVLAAAGRVAQAIETVEPVVETQQLGAMECMADLLERSGELARAETLAVAAWGRYPDSPEAQARAIALCWRQHKHTLAARALVRAPVALSADAFREALAPRFLDCFRAQPKEGVRAIEAILAAGAAPAGHLTRLALALDEAGAHRMAWEVQSRIPQDGEEAVTKLGLCYRYMRRWKGAPEALAWLRLRDRDLTAEERTVLAYVGYGLEEYDLLWEVEAGDPDRIDADFHWLLRAAAAVRSGGRDHRRAALERHFAAPSRERYVVLGRFLLGLEDAAAALATATDPKSSCESYYYLGLRAQAAGAIREAARWYARCLATGQSYNGEYRWAGHQLDAWMARDASLDRLEAEARRGRPPALAGGGD